MYMCLYLVLCYLTIRTLVSEYFDIVDLNTNEKGSITHTEELCILCIVSVVFTEMFILQFPEQTKLRVLTG